MRGIRVGVEGGQPPAPPNDAQGPALRWARNSIEHPKRKLSRCQTVQSTTSNCLGLRVFKSFVTFVVALGEATKSVSVPITVSPVSKSRSKGILVKDWAVELVIV